MSLLTRTEVCQLLGVSPKSLYLWEQEGRIPEPPRNHRGWRVYGPKDVSAIRRAMGITEDVPASSSRRTSRGKQQAAATDAAALSARNQLRGVVVSLRRAGLLCEIVLRLGDGQEITSIITGGSADRLGLRKGQPATAVIKATEVMILH